MRRSFLILFYLGLINSLSFCQISDKQNILFIVVDDLNDYIEGLDGQPQIKTPNIKYLIDEGYLFTNTFANSPVCGPSRTSLLSGKDMLYTQVYANNAYLDEFRDNFTIDKNNEQVITLPEHLKDAGGYYTCGINKVFHDPFNKDYDVTTIDPCQKELSWSRSISFNDFAYMLDSVETYYEGVDKFKWGRLPDEMEQDLKDYRAVDTAIKVLQEIVDGDIAICDSAFFLALGFGLPHLNIYVPEKYFPEYYMNDFEAEEFILPYNDPMNLFPPTGIIMPPQPKIRWSDYDSLGPLGKSIALGQADIEESFTLYAEDIPLPFINEDYTDSMRFEVVEEAKRANAIMAYMAGIQMVDHQIGRLLEFMQAHPDLYENTIIILISDNGFAFGEKHHWMKRSFWETDVRVPLIVFDPSKPGGIKCDQTVSLLDLYPTILDMTNTPYPVFDDSSYYLDGKSFITLLDNPETPWERPVLMTFESEENKECSCFPQFAIRSEKFKYIRYSSDGDDPALACNLDSSFNEEELYEIGKYREIDPHEWNNLISNSDYDPIVNYLQQWMPDSALYLQKTYKTIITTNTLPCLAGYEDTIKLSFDLFDTTGNIISPPADHIFLWTNNLTDDSIISLTTDFPLQLIDEAVFAANSRIMFYLQMIDPSNNAVVALDNKYFYLNEITAPHVSFSANYGITLSANISDLIITGIYNSIWWDFGEGNLIYSETPGPYIYSEPGTYAITCYLQYGNNPDCIESFVQTITVDISENIKPNSLFIFPNPSNSFVNIYTNLYTLDGMILITDMTGRVIQKINLNSNDYPYTQIEIGNYIPGVYGITHLKEDIVETGSFIVSPD